VRAALRRYDTIGGPDGKMSGFEGCSGSIPVVERRQCATVRDRTPPPELALTTPASDLAV
jgi:hypothetical protein